MDTFLLRHSAVLLLSDVRDDCTCQPRSLPSLSSSRHTGNDHTNTHTYTCTHTSILINTSCTIYVLLWLLQRVPVLWSSRLLRLGDGPEEGEIQKCQSLACSQRANRGLHHRLTRAAHTPQRVAHPQSLSCVHVLARAPLLCHSMDLPGPLHWLFVTSPRCHSSKVWHLKALGLHLYLIADPATSACTPSLHSSLPPSAS